MAQERKGYRYKEVSEGPKNRFWASADDYVFYDADPLTEEEKALAASIWDELTGGKASKGTKLPKGKETNLAKK